MAREQKRRKLLEAITFFAEKTKHCQKTKLFKLLFLFDFCVFRETGKSPTGLDYFAWPKGPVPRELFSELKHPPADLAKRILVKECPKDDPDFNERGILLIPKGHFDSEKFTKRELRILEHLAMIYRDASANDMIEVTHLKGRPWHQVYEVEGRAQELIPYELALDNAEGAITKEQATIIAEEQRDIEALFR